MHAIVISGEPESIFEKALEIAKENNIHKLDTTILEFEKALGIEEVRKIQERIILKPFKRTTKALIVKALFGITAEAQNAMLKLLEEPPRNTIIILLVQNKNILLSTVLSRCKIIEVENATRFSEKELDEEFANFSKFLAAETGERMLIAQNLAKDKNQALLSLEKIILAARKKILEKPDPTLVERIKILNSYYYDLKNTNVNLRLTLENLFLNL